MSDRDRLIELLKVCLNDENIETDDGYVGFGVRYENIADYLLANGVIVPPCKVGDTVYRVMADKRIKRPYEYKVIGFWYSADENCNNLHLVRYVNGVFDCSMSVPFSEFNRILFLTKEEAEEKLKELGK